MVADDGVKGAGNVCGLFNDFNGPILSQGAGKIKK